jgi:cytochrome c
MSLLRRLPATLIALGVLASIAPAADEAKVLVFSKTKGFRHDSIEVGTQAIKEIGKEGGFAVDATEDSGQFNDETLRKYRAVVWLNTTGDVLDDAQQAAFERFIKAGGGYAGVHSASDTEYDWPWYGKLVGAYFKSHPHQQKAKLEVLDKKHPSTAHLPDVWERFDEWYTFRKAPEKVKVLIKIDEKSYEGGGMDNNHPVCWYQDIDGGRAFYTASGHTKESYAEPEFRKHLLGGIRYAIGDKPLDFSRVAPSEARFERTVISREMKDPMQFTILGDGRIVVVDRMGTVHVIRKDGTSVATEVPIYAVGSGKPNWEDGMIGVAGDPDFAKNPYVYILHAVKGDEPKEHLMRYGFNGDHIDIASGKTVLEIRNCRTVIGHCGGGLSFGPDRTMFISTGDNTTPFESDGFSPLDTRVEGKDARATSANANDLRGKILRIRIKTDGTYEIPKGNLFPPGTPDTRPEIYVMGCRNPFRHHYDPVTGFLLWGEVGPDSGNDSATRGPRGHDEFNRAKGPGNFGWPLFVGDNKAYNAYDFESKKAGERFHPTKPLNDSSRNTGIKDLPPAQPALLWYPASNSPEFPELGNGGRCAMGGPVYRFDKGLASEDKFPLYYEGKWFIYEWMRQWIKVVTLDKDGNYAGSEDFAPGIKWKKPMDMKFGPDGALYVLEYGNNWSDNTDSQLSKVVFAGGNRAPVAMATADRFVGKDPLTVVFSSAGTIDKDEGDTLAYTWDFGGKGASSEANPSFTFKEPGVYNVSLTVKDKGGKVASTGLPIRVGNAEPKVVIVEPKAGSFFAWGKPLPFKVEVSDEEDGSTADGKLPASKIQVSGTYQDGAPAAKGYEAAMLTGGSDKGRKLVGGSDCLACHQMQVQSVGPSFVAISQKYHKQDVLGKLTEKIINGGSGVWGPMAMAPHPQHTPADVKEMAAWILSLADAPPPISGASGSLTTVAKPDKNDRGVYIVTASYADQGAKGQPSLTGTASVVLRSRYLKAVDCTTNKGAQAEDCSDEGKGRSFGFIDHDDHITFAGIDLAQTKAIEVRYASAGAGGIIEVHAGSPTGALVAKIDIGQTGGWQTWKTSAAVDVTDPGGAQELFFVFKSKSGSGGGLFNINWVHFVEK